MGIDLPAPIGAPVLAAAGGVVQGLDWADGYGTIVVIKHDDGTHALYAHLGERSVRGGERVRIGQPIGRVGMSGNATGRGSYLHFEITATGFNAFDRRGKRSPTEWIAGGEGR